MCLPIIKNGTAGQPFVMVGIQIIAHQKKALVYASAFFVIEVSDTNLQSSDLSYRISDAKRKSEHSQMFATRKTQTRTAFTKIQKHLEHLSYS